MTRTRLWQILEPATPSDRTSRAFDLFILALIVLNIVALVVGTVPEVAISFGGALSSFEALSVAIFTVEYFCRVWAAPEDLRYRGPKGRVRWASSPLAIVDLLAILPFYLPAGILDLRFLRVLRLFRLARIAKLARYSHALQLLGRVAARKRGELYVTGAVLVVLLLSASSLIYFAEHEAQPEGFRSIPRSFWWAVVTLTTVGYGDVYPVTAAGKVVGSFVAILGIGLFALPAGILGAGLIEELGTQKRPCPHCGGDVP